MNTKRNASFDFLRIIAAFSVVVLHASAHLWYYRPINSWDWFITNAYNALFRFGVPIFVMISGALFLQQSEIISIKKLFLHNILRLFLLYCVWSAFYTALGFLGKTSAAFTLKDTIKSFLTGPYHLWFLPMLIGIYFILPILQRWVQNAPKTELEYFLLLFVVLQIGKTTLSCFIKTPEVLQFLDTFQAEMACSYIGYFVLGYYLKAYSPSAKIRKWLYIAFPFCCGANILLSTFLSRRNLTPTGTIFDSFGIFTMIICVTIFLFSMHIFKTDKLSSLTSDILKELSLDTLGVYLIHLAVMENPWFIGMLYTVSPILSIPLVSLLTFILCILLSAILRRIPFIGRYLC